MQNHFRQSFESWVAGLRRLLETWSPCSRPFAILPVSAVSDAQKLATGNFFARPSVCFLVTFCRAQKVTTRTPSQEVPRFCKPRISTPKQQIRTNKIKSFRRLGVTFLVAAATFLPLRGRKCVNAYCRTCPLPRTIYFVVVKAVSPIGPRTCSFCVDMPISAPKPNSSPSVKRVDALT